LTFEVPVGTLASFIGPNGAGKTTTLRMLVGLLPPTACGWSLGRRPTVDHPAKLRREE
jgi:ABC-2 type transport system ATP-binding protein